MYDTSDKIFLGFLAMLVAGLLLGIGHLIYVEVVADKFYLRKDQWACSSSHVETTEQFIQVGGVTVPTTMDTVVCDQWSRR